MIGKELINYMIPPLKANDPVSKAKLWMRELRLFELPVIKEDRFLGLITDEILEEKESGEIGEFELEGATAVVNQNQHYYEILRVANREAVNLVAIIDDYNKYLGVVALEDVVEAFSNTSSVRSPGSVIMIRLNAIDYSLSEISRLVEENGVKILSSYVISNEADPSKIQLTLKLSSDEIGHVIETLRRFSYLVETNYQENSSDSQEKERLDGLLNYLDL